MFCELGSHSRQSIVVDDYELEEDRMKI